GRTDAWRTRERAMGRATRNERNGPGHRVGRHAHCIRCRGCGADRAAVRMTDESISGSPGVRIPEPVSMLRRVSVNSAWLILQPLLVNVVSLVAMGYIARRLG